MVLWRCQYSADYDKIALPAQYIDFAVKYANKVAFIDSRFRHHRAFCKNEGREHPFVRKALIDEYASFDPVILLENNTPW